VGDDPRPIPVCATHGDRSLAVRDPPVTTTPLPALEYAAKHRALGADLATAFKAFIQDPVTMLV
jgi:hypothetical protein